MLQENHFENLRNLDSNLLVIPKKKYLSSNNFNIFYKSVNLRIFFEMWKINKTNQNHDNQIWMTSHLERFVLNFFNINKKLA